MANITGNLATWSATAASNQPDTSDPNTIVADLQAIQGVVRGYLASRATIASGSTVDLSTLAAIVASVTHSSGTTAISSFGTLAAGMWKVVTFAITGGTLTLTHHATQLIIPGAASVTLANGDSLLAESLGSGNWKVHIFQRAAGVFAATQAQQEAGSSDAVAVTPANQHFHPSAAKGWAKFSVAGALSAAYNVISVDDIGAGNWVVNITTDLSSANYVAQVTFENNSTNNAMLPLLFTQTGGQSTVRAVSDFSGTLADPEASIHWTAYGDI